MKIFLSRRNFLKKTSKGIFGASFVSAVGYSFDFGQNGLSFNQKSAKGKSSVSKTICEFGVEGSAPREGGLSFGGGSQSCCPVPW